MYHQYEGQQIKTLPAGRRKDKTMKKIYTSFDELPVMLTVPEMASVLGISRAGAYELAHSKGFPTLTIGGRIVIPKDKLLNWIDENTGNKI